MRYQSLPARCGPASLREALRVYGITRTEDELAVLAKTTNDGTGARGLMRALRSVKPDWEPVAKHERPDIAVLRVFAALREGVPVILCVDAMDHWVAAVGLSGYRAIVADPAHDELYLYLTAPELVARWEHSGRCYYILWG